MAARSVFKLFAKTCSCTINPQAPSTAQSTTKEPNVRKQSRSVSYSPTRHYKSTKEQFWQIRNVSKSFENFREQHEYKDEEEDYEAPYDTGSSTFDRNVFPPPKDMTVRDLAKEFKPPPTEEINEDGNPVFELAESGRSQENVFDVINYMRQVQYDKAKYSFTHLQPCSIKPYGSFENVAQESSRKRIKIVYPVVHTTVRADNTRKKKIDDTHYKEFSSCSTQKRHSALEKVEKMSVVEPKPNDYKNQCHSTSFLKKKPSDSSKRVRFVSTSFSRLPSNSLLKNKRSTSNKQQYHDGTMDGQLDKCKQSHNAISDTQAKTLSRLNLSKIIKSSKEIFLHQVRTNTKDSQRCPTNDIEPEPPCDKYVTVKLNECEDECGKPKKCKPIKKIRFGRLPKLPTSDCPCVEDIPLKEGKPLQRIQKRFDVPDRDNTCPIIPCEQLPRADKDYKIVQKQLPVLTLNNCFPCDPPEMIDLVIRRLPKRKVPDPPPKCPCLPDCDPCPPRADAGYVVKPKLLPKFGNNDCPCVDAPPMTNFNLKRLVAKAVQEPPKICPVPCKEMNPDRADFGVGLVERKPLPALKGDCPCVPPVPMDEGKPFKRLRKMKVTEPPRICPPPPCDLIERADQHLRVKPKKLPVYTSSDCPCVELEPPCDVPKLKRLVPKYTPKVKEKYCPPPPCPPRADDGLKVTRKHLPVIQVQDCPCEEIEMLDCPPLKKLIPRPVFVPKCKVVEECIIPRTDVTIKVERKKLPPLPPGDCPCVEPPQPLDVAPLKRLSPRPVFVKRFCPPMECYTALRADVNLKVAVKRLPKFEVPDCPCVELLPPEDVKPLKRLKRKPVAEPPRVCPIDPCEEIPRSDEDDWMYWKCVPVAHCETTEEAPAKTPAKAPAETSKRSVRKVSRRYYSTNSTLKTNFFNLKYNAPSLIPSSFKQQSHDVIIDIQPAAPLILTQKPLKVDGKSLQRSKSEPVDCVTFVIYKSNGLGKGKRLRESPSELSLIFQNRNRYISTCSTLYESAEPGKGKDTLKDHQTPSCECPPNDKHLQPKHPILPEREEFIKTFPSDRVIEEERRKGKLYYKARKDGSEATGEEDEKDVDIALDCKARDISPDCEVKESDVKDCEIKEEPTKEPKTMSLWEKIVNYFKARPDCPPPEEFKRLRMKEAAERAARKAGLCVYDPKEMLRKNEKELPKVITADSVKEECSK